jgi:DNA-binding transcriptional LysR family regulator
LRSGAAYLEKRGAPREPEELTRHECMLYAYHEIPTSWALTNGERQAQIKVSGALVTNSGQMLVEAASRGLGIIFVPIFHAASHLRDGRLVQVLPGWRRPSPVPIHALYPAARHLPAKVRVVVDFFKDLLRTPPWAGWEAPARNQGARSS